MTVNLQHQDINHDMKLFLFTLFEVKLTGRVLIGMTVKAHYRDINQNITRSLQQARKI